MEYSFKNYKMSTIYLYKDFLKDIEYRKKLHRDNRSKKIAKPDYSNVRPMIKDSLNSDIDQMFQKDIELFRREFIRTTDPQLVNEFERNLASLKVYGVVFQYGDLARGVEKFSGKYLTDENVILINISHGYNRDDLFHELMHMAACCRRNPNNIKSGLDNKVDGVSTYGMNLSHGYAEYLCDKKLKAVGFKAEKDIYYYTSMLLEQIIGEEMESMNFNQRLDLFVGELSKYRSSSRYRNNDSEQEVITFIKHIDRISTVRESQVRQGIANSIFSTIISAFITKQLFAYGSFENIPSNIIINFLQLIPDTIPCEDSRKIASRTGEYTINKHELLKNAYEDVIYRYPELIKQKTA